MSAFVDPALKAFVSEIRSELVFAQILIRRSETGFELRHGEDGERAPETLRLISESEIRPLTQFTASGAFRPLRSAPNLQTGWRFLAADEAKLGFALNQFYPGAIADWFAARFSRRAATNYRDFTNRQTGMYRITAMLSDEQAAPMIRACCHKNFCLKQRLWTAGTLTPDLPEEKSLIPCLDPCALLLEFARKAMRLEQAEAADEKISVNENSEPTPEVREADFESPSNPRRIQLAIEKNATPVIRPAL